MLSQVDNESFITIPLDKTVHFVNGSQLLFFKPDFWTHALVNNGFP